MIKTEKGVTLVALVIMVIIVTILATVVTYNGISSYKNAQITAFVKRMEVIEEKVKTLSERAEVDSGLAEKLGLSESTTNDIYGEDISDSSDRAKQTWTNLNSDGAKDSENYRYFSNDDVKSQLGLDNIDGSYIINFRTGEVFSVEGVEYKDNIVYSISEIKD